MIFKLFRSYNPFLIVLIPLIGIAVWWQAFQTETQNVFHFDTYQMFLYKATERFFEGFPLISKISCFILLLIQVFILNQLNKKYLIVNVRTYLPAFFFIIITSSFIELQRINPAVFASFFLIMAIDKVFDSYRIKGLAYHYFEAAFFISLGSLFYLPAAFFIIFLWFAAAQLRPFHWREWLFPILGLITPYILLTGYYYVFKQELFYFIDYLTTNFNYHVEATNYFTLPYMIFYGFILFITFIAIMHIFSSLFKKKIQARKSFTLFTWLLIISLAIFFFDASASFEMIYLIAVPMSFLLSDYFAHLRSRAWGDVIFILIFLNLIFIELTKYNIIKL